MNRLRRFAAYYRPHRGLFALDMTCSFLAAACDLVYPMITRRILNVYIPNGAVRSLILWAGFLLCLYIAKLFLNYVVQYYGHIVGVRMQAQMRREVFAHLQTLPFSYFDNHKSGKIMSRIVNDLQDVSELAHHGPEDLFLSAVMLVGSFVLLFPINGLLTVIVFLCIPLILCFTVYMRRQMRETFTRTRREIAEVNAELENSIAGIRVSKAFTGADYELQKFERANRSYERSREDSYRVMGRFFSGMAFSTDLINVVILLAGGWAVYCRSVDPTSFFGMDIADFVTFTLYISLFLTPIRRLTQFSEMFQQGMTGFDRFLEILDEPSEAETPGAGILVPRGGEVRFEDVSFRYGEGDEVLTHLSLTVPAGETVALVGPSGGGKTTLCHLLPRFYELTGGRILIDGQDTRQVTLDSLRRAIGIVQQEVFLFTGTIRDNIAYGNPEADDAAIVEAAKRANIHDFILSLKDGYQTYVGERGVKLSGGQKQRLSIARVFLKNPPILILDEATSALDNATEALIQASLSELCRGRTTLVVAHRLSTVRHAGEIVVLTEHGVEERGTHAALLRAGGLYASLYQAQFEGL